MNLKVLITGKGGQLAWELERSLPAGYEALCLGVESLDITEKEAVFTALEDFRPELVINAAAYTAVDKAESDSELAYAVNEVGAENIALACKEVGARLLHVSTDFVFSGDKAKPYVEDDEPAPLGVYGASKLAGDLKVSQVLGNAQVIVRTAWVYSAHGNNFVKTMLRLMKEKPELNIIYDQVGTPTWAKGLAMWLWSVAEKPEVTGMFHWTDAGVASWYDFAIAIQELAVEKGMLSQEIPIYPIPTSSYPTPAKRPSFSILDKSRAEEASGLKSTHWRKQLAGMLEEL